MNKTVCCYESFRWVMIIMEHAIMEVLARYELPEEKLCREQVCGEEG